MSKVQTCRDDSDFYHFDIHALRRKYKAGMLSPFSHDYKPQLEPIRAPLVQDLPDWVRKGSPGTLQRQDRIDPYLPIAELRTSFEGKGRKLGGYLIMIEGLRVDGTDYRPYSINHMPSSWKNMHMDIFGNGMWANLDGVHPFAIFHLNYLMAYPYRRTSYHQAVSAWKKGIQEATTAEERESKIGSLNDMLNIYGMKVDQGNREDFQDFLDAFPKAPQQRQMMMPPNVVKIPGEPLEWVQLEAAIKRHMEYIVQNGYLAISSVNVIATDMDGATEIGGCFGGKMYAGQWLEYGNYAYWVTMQRSIFHGMLKWLPNGHDGWVQFAEFILDRYDLNINEYLARDVGPWKEVFSDWELEWMKDTRIKYQAMLAERKLEM